MKMKGIVTVLLAVLFSTCAWAQKVSSVRLATGATTIVDNITFPIENVNVATKGIVSTNVQNGKLQLVGQRIGSTDVMVSGNGMSMTLKVTVIDDLRETMNSLKHDLDALSELKVDISNGKLKLTGNIESIADMKLKNKILKAYGDDLIMDLTTFKPAPEVMARLEKSFKNAGFEIAKSDEGALEPGVIAIRDDSDNDRMFFKAKVYSDKDKEKIQAILDAEPWLKDSKSKGNSELDDYKVAYQLDVEVDNVTLQVDIVHIAVTQSESERIGLDWNDFFEGGTTIAMDAFKTIAYASNNDARGAVRTAGNTFDARTGMSAALGLMAKNDIGRIRYSGFLTFKSNGAKEPSKLHLGGTVYLQDPTAQGNGVLTQLKEVEYGLLMEVVGGLTGKDQVDLELTQSVSYPVPKNNRSSDGYELMNNGTSKTPIHCKLGEAIAIGGGRSCDVRDATTGSIPYLRNVPVLRWLVSQDKDDFEDKKIITVISVRKMDGSAAKIDPLSDQLMKLKQADDAYYAQKDAEQPVEEPKPWWKFWKK